MTAPNLIVPILYTIAKLDDTWHNILHNSNVAVLFLWKVQAQGGSKNDPPSFFVHRLPRGFLISQGGFNPPNPPANFYPGLNW
jgi:hypothetical protein